MKNAADLSTKKAFAAMSLPGARLMTMHTQGGEQFFVVPGGPVSAADARQMMVRLNLQEFDDGLFPGNPQSWRIGTS